MELNLRRTLDAGLIAELNKEVQDLHVAEHPDVFKPYIKKDIESFFSSLITQSDMISKCCIVTVSQLDM
ncbi:hypothetical protein [Corticicoccus populi]|uniref:Uncharacterized protein n=1 Tax=Corticicoccus populi TaxID=1812821 RepID=A0ABW5WXP6_9STAP